jgi:hypothetical protein
MWWRSSKFTKHFGSASGTTPKISDPVIKHLITTFAYSTHLGPTQTTKHLKGQYEARDIRYINRHQMTAQNLYLATKAQVSRQYQPVSISSPPPPTTVSST